MGSSQISLVYITGSQSSKCGYCHSDQPTSNTFGMWTEQLTCQDYQDLIDRGWRRSGKYVYKPDLRSSCCPQYTIRLNAKEYKITKSQRKVLSKFNRYIEGEWSPEEEQIKPVKHKPNKLPALTLADLIHSSENKETPQEHRFKVVLEPSSCTDEKFALYKKYQIAVHHDEPSKLKESSFREFLVDSPLIAEKSTESGSRHFSGYGSFHQKYLLDDKIIAMAVLDILPKCASSVYFMYDPDYAFLGLGKYSALREICLVQELSQKLQDLHWYYMGFYIHCCPKMNYKGQYQPSDLLDPESYDWYPLEAYRNQLDKKKFVTFADPDRSPEDEESKSRPSGWLDTESLQDKELERVPTMVRLHGNRVMTLNEIKKYMHPADFADFKANIKETAKDFVASVGHELAGRMCLLYA